MATTTTNRNNSTASTLHPNTNANTMANVNSSNIVNNSNSIGNNHHSHNADLFLYDFINDLYNNQLYHDVIQAVRFFDNNLQKFRETFGVIHGLNVLFFYGISLFHVHEYKLALQIFQQAVTFYSDYFSQLNKTNNTENVNVNDPVVVGHEKAVSNATSPLTATTVAGSVKRKTIGGENCNTPSLEAAVHQQTLPQILCTVAELKFQMHLCYKKLGENQCAINTLQSIPRESQTLKTLIALGDLCLETNNYREALICYKNAVFKNPMALYTLKKYLNHANDKRAEEFTGLLTRKIESKLPVTVAEQVQEYIRAQNLARHPRQFKQVCQAYFDLGKGKSKNKGPSLQNQQPTIASLQHKSLSSDNMYMMLEAARHLYYDGFISNANFFFQKIFSLNRNLIEGLDCFASCLYRDSKEKQLYKLTCDVIAMCSSTLPPKRSNESSSSSSTSASTPLTTNVFDYTSNAQTHGIMANRPEPWIVIGFYNLSKRDPKALMFANKALTIDNSSEEAMILKTLIYNRKVCKDTGNFVEEIQQFIYRIKNQKTYIRFEFLKYLAEAVLEKDGRDAAEVYAKQAIDRFGMTTRICTFYCSFIYADRYATITEREKALNMLEESVKSTPFYMSASVNLSKFYMKDSHENKAIPLLEKLLEKFDYEFIHQMLVECYRRTGQHEKAEIHRIDYLRGRGGCESDFNILSKQKAKEENINETLSEMDLTYVSSISPYDDINEST